MKAEMWVWLAAMVLILGVWVLASGCTIETTEVLDCDEMRAEIDRIALTDPNIKCTLYWKCEDDE